MESFIINVAKSIAERLGQDGVFIVFISLETLSFVLNLIFSCCICDYAIKQRLWQPLFSAFLVFVSAGVCSVAELGVFITYMLAGYSVLAFIPVVLIRVKSFKITEKQRDLVKFIDSNILETKPTSCKEDCRKIACENFTEKLEDESNVSNFEIDFQHVKSVIARLDYFGLKESDKKQVKELESALMIAERGEFNQQVKVKINDGLGALLKIMSKYGV